MTQAPYLGQRQIECLRLLAAAGKERTVRQLFGKQASSTRVRSMRLLEDRGLVVARWGWAGLSFCLTEEGLDALEELQ